MLHKDNYIFNQDIQTSANYFKYENITEIQFTELIKDLEDNVDLRNLTPLDNYMDAERKKLTAKSLENKQTVIYLDLSNNNIGNEGAEEIAKTLKKNNTLSWLNIGDNQIEVEGISKIAKALKKNNTLNFLDLKGNFIKDMGAEEIASALEENHGLISLNLSVTFNYNDGFDNISDIGAVKIIETLKKNNTLRFISISGNDVSDDGAIKIAEVLKENDTLILLDIKWNRIRVKGIKAIIDSLSNNKSLVSLNMKGTLIEAKDIKEILRALSDNNSILELIIDCNKNSYNEIQNYIDSNIHLFEERCRLISEIVEDQNVLSKNKKTFTTDEEKIVQQKTNLITKMSRLEPKLQTLCGQLDYKIYKELDVEKKLQYLTIKDNIRLITERKIVMSWYEEKTYMERLPFEINQNALKYIPLYRLLNQLKVDNEKLINNENTLNTSIMITSNNTQPTYVNNISNIVQNYNIVSNRPFDSEKNIIKN